MLAKRHSPLMLELRMTYSGGCAWLELGGGRRAGGGGGEGRKGWRDRQSGHRGEGAGRRGSAKCVSERRLHLVGAGARIHVYPWWAGANTGELGTDRDM